MRKKEISGSLRNEEQNRERLRRVAGYRTGSQTKNPDGEGVMFYVERKRLISFVGLPASSSGAGFR